MKLIQLLEIKLSALKYARSLLTPEKALPKSFYRKEVHKKTSTQRNAQIAISNLPVTNIYPTTPTPLGGDDTSLH